MPHAQIFFRGNYSGCHESSDLLSQRLLIGSFIVEKNHKTGLFYKKLSASRYAFISANSPSLPLKAFPCSIPNIPLNPFL